MGRRRRGEGDAQIAAKYAQYTNFDPTSRGSLESRTSCGSTAPTSAPTSTRYVRSADYNVLIGRTEAEVEGRLTATSATAHRRAPARPARVDLRRPAWHAHRRHSGADRRQSPAIRNVLPHTIDRVLLQYHKRTAHNEESTSYSFSLKRLWLAFLALTLAKLHVASGMSCRYAHFEIRHSSSAPSYSWHVQKRPDEDKISGSCSLSFARQTCTRVLPSIAPSLPQFLSCGETPFFKRVEHSIVTSAPTINILITSSEV